MDMLEEYLSFRRGAADEPTRLRVQAALQDPASELHSLLKGAEEFTKEQLVQEPVHTGASSATSGISPQSTGDAPAPASILGDFLSVRARKATPEQGTRVAEALGDDKSELRESLRAVQARFADLIGRHRIGIWDLAAEATNENPALTHASPDETADHRPDRGPGPTTISVNSMARFRRFWFFAASAAACLLIGLFAGVNWDRGAKDHAFQTYMASAEIGIVPDRGAGGNERNVVIHSERNGFASIIALFPDDSPMIFPRLGSGAIPVRAGDTESPALPAGFDDAPVALVVITNQPATEVLERAYTLDRFRSTDAEELQGLLTEALQAHHYQWAAFTRLTLSNAPK